MRGQKLPLFSISEASRSCGRPPADGEGAAAFLAQPGVLGVFVGIGVSHDAEQLDVMDQEEAVRVRTRWLESTLEAGILAGNLERLGREYRRVERRAKALVVTGTPRNFVNRTGGDAGAAVAG